MRATAALATIAAVAAVLAALRARETEALLDSIRGRAAIAVVRSDARSLPDAAARGFTFERPDEAAVRDYAPLLARELSIYPESFIRRVPIERIVLCRDLFIGGAHAPGITDCRLRTIFIEAGGDFGSDERRVKAIHHELFHTVDFAECGQTFRDPDWEALNPRGFAYLGSGVGALGRRMSLELSSATPGFVCEYATAAAEEDKAELFAALVVNPGWVAARAREDVVLARKIASLKATLEARDPAMNAGFWVSLARP